jgi:hypothetical protein
MKSSHRKEDRMFTQLVNGAYSVEQLRDILNHLDPSSFSGSVLLLVFPVVSSPSSATASPRGEPSTPQKPEDKPESSEAGSHTIKVEDPLPARSSQALPPNWSNRWGS